MKTYSRRQAIQTLSTGLGGILFGNPLMEMALVPVVGSAQFFNRNIPNEAHTEMGKLAKYGIAVFAFTPGNGWVIVTEDGRHFARNIPDECYSQLKTFISQGHKIRSIAFPPKSGSNSWVIVTDRTHFARNIPDECFKKLNAYKSSKYTIRHVAFPPQGGNSWVIVADQAFHARNIPDECFQVMNNLQESPRPGRPAPRKIHHVSFAPSGGWVVLAEDYFFARNIPDECFAQLGNFKGKKRQNDIVAFSPEKSGWSAISSTSFVSAPQDEIRNFENSVGTGGIWQLMRDKKVPGVSVAVVLNNRLAWSCGYGFTRTGKSGAMHPDSFIGAASNSKVFGGIAAMKLVEAGKIKLSDDIRDKISWTIPVKSGVSVKQAPTLELLLGHQAGFNVHGVGGYTSKEKIPTLKELLEGSGNASNAKIQIEQEPGSTWKYSGGGFLMLDKLIKDLSGGTPAADWMNTNLLAPMGMRNSTFSITVPNSYSGGNNLAYGHNTKGEEYFWRRYPQACAAGLHTTAPDLARLIIMMNQGGTIDGKRILKSDSVERMYQLVNSAKSSTQGIAVKVRGKRTDNSFRYYHGGYHNGLNSQFFGFPNQQAGVVVLTNGEASTREIIAQAVRDTYGWG